MYVNSAIIIACIDYKVKLGFRYISNLVKLC